MLQKVVRGDRTLFFWETGHFIVWDPDHLTSGIRDIFLGNGTFYPLGRNLSSGIRTAYPLGSGTPSGKRTVGNGPGYPLGSGPGYPLGSVLWDRAIWEMRYNPMCI